MLRGTCYYNKKIKVENVAESAEILTNVQTCWDCASSVLRFWHFQQHSQLLFFSKSDTLSSTSHAELTEQVKTLIVSVTKFSIVIGPLHAYLSRNCKAVS